MKSEGNCEHDRLNERDPRSYAIIGAAMEVHRLMGRGFLESVSHEALAVEFTSRGIPFQHEVELRVRYKGRELSGTFKADFVCFDDPIVKIKAMTGLTDREFSQVINYLRATRAPIGVLLNFGAKSLEYKRFVDSKQPNP